MVVPSLSPEIITMYGCGIRPCVAEIRLSVTACIPLALFSLFFFKIFAFGYHHENIQSHLSASYLIKIHK